MTSRFLSEGWSASLKRPGLAGLLYAGNLVLGIILSIPILMAFSQAVSETGYSPELAKEFDIALWADLMQESGPMVSTMLRQLFWIIPVFYLWKVGSTIGVVYAMRGERDGSFWAGLGKYGGRALLLGLPFVAMAVVAIVGILLLTVVLGFALPGEVIQFWIRFVGAPILILMLLAILDLMHDFARLELVLRERPVMTSWWAGIGWFFRSGSAQAIYLTWLIISVVALIVPFWVDLAMGGLFLAFLFQQALLYVRSLVTVGWLTSEVMLFEELTVEDDTGEPVPSAEFAA